jgi:hypothetical protein
MPDSTKQRGAALSPATKASGYLAVNFGPAEIEHVHIGRQASVLCCPVLTVHDLDRRVRPAGCSEQTPSGSLSPCSRLF